MKNIIRVLSLILISTILVGCGIFKKEPIKVYEYLDSVNESSENMTITYSLNEDKLIVNIEDKFDESDNPYAGGGLSAFTNTQIGKLATVQIQDIITEYKYKINDIEVNFLINGEISTKLINGVVID